MPEVLTWPRVKDKLLIVLGSAAVALLGLIYSRQESMGEKMSILQSDVAVLVASGEWKQAEMSEIKDRLRTLEMGRN